MSVTEQNYTTSTNDEIGLAELFDIIWRGKWLVILFSVFFAVGSVFYALQLPNIYRAEIVLSPIGKDRSIQLPGQLSGLASLAGVNLGGGGNDNTNLSLEILVSREFLGRFINKNAIKPELIAASSWDFDLNRVIFDEDIYDESSSRWVRKPRFDRPSEPTILEATEFFKRNFSLNRDKSSGMIKLTFDHVSPVLAKTWLNNLVNEINQEMRNREIEESQRSIDYLTKLVDTTTQNEIRSSIFSLIQEQTKTLMLANVRDEFAFKIVDPAVVPEKKHSPKRSIIVILFTLAGFFLSLLIVIFKGVSNIKKSLISN